MWFIVMFHPYYGVQHDVSIVYAVDSEQAIELACEDAVPFLHKEDGPRKRTEVDRVLCTYQQQPTTMLDWLSE